jgi:protein associated with RNAse G/E
MRKVKVISRKYNGSLRDEYEAFLYAEDEQRITLYSPPGLEVFDHRISSWVRAPDGFLEYFFKTKWYVVCHFCEPLSKQNLIYIHLSIPASFTNDVLEWVDLDLDYRVYLDGSIERVDEQEFEHHSQIMSYPQEVIAQVWATCAEIEHLYQQQRFPCNYQEQVTIYESIRRGDTHSNDSAMRVASSSSMLPSRR